MDVPRLAQILYMDSSHKFGVAHSMDAKSINKLYVMKNETGMTASILPINDNVHVQEYAAQEDPKIVVSTGFRDNKLEMIHGEKIQPQAPAQTIESRSPQRIKTNIFAAMGRSVSQWSLTDRFASAGKAKSSPSSGTYVGYKAEELQPLAETTVVYDDVVVPFKRKTLTLASGF